MILKPVFISLVDFLALIEHVFLNKYKVYIHQAQSFSPFIAHVHQTQSLSPFTAQGLMNTKASGFCFLQFHLETLPLPNDVFLQLVPNTVGNTSFPRYGLIPGMLP